MLKSRKVLNTLRSKSVILALVISFTLTSSAVWAFERDVKAVLITSAYGAVGGTLVGLASLPIHRSGRSVFMGTSLGLYLGAIVGFYYIGHRDDRGNPLTESTPALQSASLASNSFNENPFNIQEGPEFETQLWALRF